MSCHPSYKTDGYNIMRCMVCGKDIISNDLIMEGRGERNLLDVAYVSRS